MYSTISQSTIITSPIGFNIALTNVDARLKQRCINVVPTLCNVVSTLCNVVSTLFQRRALTFYQRCATLKIWRRILFHFQRQINVISDVEMLAGVGGVLLKDYAVYKKWINEWYNKHFMALLRAIKLHNTIWGWLPSITFSVVKIPLGSVTLR